MVCLEAAGEGIKKKRGDLSILCDEKTEGSGSLCKSADCRNEKKKDYYSSEVYKYINDSLLGEHQRCPKCGEMRKEINPANNVPLSEKNIGINLFDGMSKDRKIEVLKKRSHEHFQSKLKERKDELLNKAMTEMKNLNNR